MLQATTVPTGIPPGWAVGLVDDETARTRPLGRGTVRVVRGPSFCLVSLVTPGGRPLSSAAFESLVTETYAELGRELDGLRRFPVRIWNFVPGINDDAGEGLDRYMVFNAGRHAGYLQWRATDVGAWVPAASAVGSGDDALVVHCLAAADPGVSVENTLQTPAYRYSHRYGPRPPCFARATVVSSGGGTYLLMSGTASIRGEDSVHLGSLDGQLRVTIENMRHLWRAAQQQNQQVRPMTDARLYLPCSTSNDAVVAALCEAFPSLVRVETVRTALCRPELLVEIEAAAVAAHAHTVVSG